MQLEQQEELEIIKAKFAETMKLAMEIKRLSDNFAERDSSS